eukprot:IDg21230t1
MLDAILSQVKAKTDKTMLERKEKIELTRNAGEINACHRETAFARLKKLQLDCERFELTPKEAEDARQQNAKLMEFLSALEIGTTNREKCTAGSAALRMALDLANASQHLSQEKTKQKYSVRGRVGTLENSRSSHRIQDKLESCAVEWNKCRRGISGLAHLQRIRSVVVYAILHIVDEEVVFQERTHARADIHNGVRLPSFDWSVKLYDEPVGHGYRLDHILIFVPSINPTQFSRAPPLSFTAFVYSSFGTTSPDDLGHVTPYAYARVSESAKHDKSGRQRVTEVSVALGAAVSAKNRFYVGYLALLKPKVYDALLAHPAART